MMLNVSGKKEYFYFVHSVKSKASSFSPLTMMLVKRIFLNVVYQVEEVLLYS